MDLQREALVMSLLEQALTQPASERAAWLRTQTSDPEIARRVEQLLALESETDRFLEEPPELPANLGVLPQPGELLGPWQLLRQLDAGGMGVVFLARRADQAYEQQVAIKLLRGDYLLADAQQRAEVVTRFDNERHLLARLDHPNIARILDGGTSVAGIPYLVMEYVDGPPLTEHCDRSRLDVRQRLALFTRVCDGVQAAHRSLIVHRDLKPGNVLVGSDGEPRLLDFGIARPLADDSGRALTQTASFAMTPAYASPEQARNEPLTTASDVYSLGVMLYELITGRRPYRLDGLTPAQSERAICETSPPTLRRAVGEAISDDGERRRRLTGIGGDLERIVAKAMHKEPSRRYDSAAALADDIRRYLDGRPVLAHPDSLGYRAGKFLRRNRLGVGAATLALGAILVAAAAALWQAREASKAAADTAQLNDFLVTMMDSSDAYSAGSEPTMSEAIEASVEHIDTRFATRPDLAASLRHSIGVNLTNRARFAAADEQLRKGLAEANASLGENAPLAFRLRSAIATSRHYQGDYREALAMAEDNLQRAEAAGLTADPLYADALNDMAYLYLNGEEWDKALPYAQRAVDSFEKHGVAIRPINQAAMLGNLAQALEGLDRPQEAIAPYERAIAIIDAQFPEGHPDAAITRNNLGLLYRALGDKEHALQLLQESAELRRQLVKPGHPLIVRGFTNAARMALEVGKVEQALANARIAVENGEQAFPEPHLHQAQALSALAEAELRHGDYTAAANTLARAETVMAGLAEPTQSAVDYLASVRTQLCQHAGDGLRIEGCPAP